MGKKFNFIDYIIILAIIIALGGFYYFYKKKDVQLSDSNYKITFQMEITKKNFNVCSSYKVGSPVIFGTSSTGSGTITDVEIYESETIQADVLAGEFVKSKAYDYYDAIVTVECVGQVTDNYIRCQEENLPVGKEVVFQGNGFVGKGYIVNVQVEENSDV